MTEYITRAQEFETPADALAHYGVKGMKWGVTQADPRGAPSKSEIVDARLKVSGRNVKYQQNIRKIKKSDASRSEKKTSLQELKVKTLSDPDRLTSLRLTRGEKVAVAMITAIAPPVGVGLAVDRAVASGVINRARKQSGVS